MEGLVPLILTQIFQMRVSIKSSSSSHKLSGSHKCFLIKTFFRISLDCYYFPSDDNSGIRSSMMAAPFLKSVDHFCNDTEIVFAHDSYKPNKHNFMCNRRSTWDVISHSKDLYGIEPMKNETAPETIFHILQPNAVARYTLVLDRSGSMKGNERLDRLQKSSVRWIKYELKTNSKLGVTSFRYTKLYTLHRFLLISIRF